jgi:phosphomethylpyrimidine synthase
MTQVLAAVAGQNYTEMELVAAKENLDVKFIQEGVTTGNN